MNTAANKSSMRHLYLYTYFLLEEAKRHGRPIRLEWGNIPTASIGPDPQNPDGLLLKLSHMAATGTEEDAILLRALIAHEVLCHGNHTDFSVKRDNDLAGMLAGRIEDPRGELLALKRFPGSKKVIREGIEILTNRGLFQGPEQGKPMHPAELLCGWLTTELRSELLGQNCLEEFSKQFRQLAIDTFGTKLVNAIKVEALKGSHAATTQGAVDAAKRIVALIEERKDEAQQQQEQEQEQEQQQPSQPEEQDQSGEDGGSQEQPDQETQGTQGAGDGDASDDKGDQNDGAGDASQDTQGSSQGQGDDATESAAGQGGQPQAGSGQAASAQGEAYEPDSAQLQTALNELLDASDGDGGQYGKDLEDLLCEGNDAIQIEQHTGSSHTNEITERQTPQAPSYERRGQLRQDAKALSAALALKMEDLLESISQVRRRPSTEGHLRPGKVWKACVGDMQICRTKTRLEEIDTCVFLLADESGSMSKEFGNMQRYHAAGRVAVAAGDVLNDAEIPFALASFDDKVREWKTFEDDWAKALARYTPLYNGSTNTDTALAWALKKFAGRNESRKVLIVCLDGDPGNRQNLDAALYEAKYTYGVEVRFVLIGNEYLNTFRGIDAAYGVANTPQELAQAVFGALEAAIA